MPQFRPVVFDWNDHSHLMRKTVLHKGTCESHDEDGEVCDICIKGAEQSNLGTDFLFLHPEKCKCFSCVRYARQKEDQIAKQILENNDIPF